MTATAVILPPGETLAGFRIREAIGIGGMAVVYRADQVSLGREVALKVLSPELGRDEVFSERFRREGMHVARLDHPNIIPIYDAGRDKGRLFLAMRLVEGMTLAERMRAEPLSAEETVHILRPIADGLDAAHATGLVHRDIKPQNILITERGHPYLTDFGVAKRVESAGLTETGGFVGSFHYAAPEQVLGTPPSPATDVYALTAVLYQCLTGTVPYSSYTDAGVLFAHVNQPPPHVPLPEARELNSVIEEGMAKDAADRYPSASELITAIERSLEGLPPARLRRRPSFPSAPDTPCEGGTVALPAIGVDSSSNIGTAPPLPPLTTADVEGSQSGLRDHGSTHKGRLRMVAGAAGLAVVGGAIVGLLLTGGGPAAAASRVARSGALSINYRLPWTRTRGAFGAFAVSPTRGTGAQAPIQLASGGVTLAAGSVGHSAVIPGGPPPALVARFGHPTLNTTTQLANGASAATYRWNSAAGRSLETWVIPTARGDLAIICSAPARMTAQLRSCAGFAMRARVSGAAVLPVGPVLALARSLKRALGGVAAGRRTLTGAHHGRVAVTATAIAREDARAATTLNKLDVPVRYAPVVSGLAAAFNAEARALTNLAHAADTNDRRKYVLASEAVEAASRNVAAASRRVATARLLTLSLPALTVPRLPAAHQTIATPASTSGTPSTTTTAASSVTTPTQSSTPSSAPSGTGSSHPTQSHSTQSSKQKTSSTQSPSTTGSSGPLH